MLTAVPKSLDFNPGDGMDVCKCKVPVRHVGTLNIRHAKGPFERLARSLNHSPGRSLENSGYTRAFGDRLRNFEPWSSDEPVAVEQSCKLIPILRD
ncbi:hypothetical protein TNCV_4841431 [Trichonephila clavipes]|uniref:Uncharacterized protein n=1 Tax=Trichonephila clavipes TaxID=2585209 RepID=A0A8X6WKL9_TRICX|nr:hypothetical protein TNCV_4841431 [Trichonephila clavipes]